MSEQGLQEQKSAIEAALSRWTTYGSSKLYADQFDVFKQKLAQIESRGKGETDPYKLVRNQALKDAFYEAANIPTVIIESLKAQLADVMTKIESQPVKGEALGGY